MKSYPLDDTIAAIATAPGGGLRGIVRISGPRAVEFAAQLIATSGDQQRAHRIRRATVLPTNILPPPLGPLPCHLHVWPTNHSYTRQPVVEVHTIGSPPALEAVLRAVCDCGGRMAEAGEFTLRAFLAGRLDLTQAEAVLGVIDAQDQQQLHVALQQLAGGLSVPLTELRDCLLDSLAHLEAGLDFVEDDIEFISNQELLSQLGGARDRVGQLVRQIASRVHSGGEPRIVLRGLPNAGKSSLLNALAGHDQALVSSQAGTTRDYVVGWLDCGGIRCQLVDTAGIEAASDDRLVAQAQSLTAEQQQHADLELLCIDGSLPLGSWEQEQLATPSERRLVVVTKCDLSSEPILVPESISTSSTRQFGLIDLKQAIAARLAATDAESQVVAATATRCRTSLEDCDASLQRAITAAREQLGDELVAAELRLALDNLGTVVGSIYTDDLLDRIFSRFCIGK